MCSQRTIKNVYQSFYSSIDIFIDFVVSYSMPAQILVVVFLIIYKERKMRYDYLKEVVIMLGVIMDSIRKNDLDAQYLCNFVNYSIYLKSLLSSYKLAKSHDISDDVDIFMTNFISDMRNLYSFLTDSEENYELTEEDFLLDGKTKAAFLAALKTFFQDKILTVEEKEYCKFKSLLFSLLESLQALQKVLKKFYCNIITINKAVDDNLIGPVLIKTVLSLKKSYLEEMCKPYTISTRVVNTLDGTADWYQNNMREIALIYDLDYEHLIYMSASDLCTDNGSTCATYVTGKGLCFSDSFVESHLLFGIPIPTDMEIVMNLCGAYPAITLDVLKRENEVLLSQKARQIGIVVSERYYSTMDLNDKRGVKAYSEYAELPVYVARNGRYEKITL